MPFADESMSVGAERPEQISRAALYGWLETELTDLIENGQMYCKDPAILFKVVAGESVGTLFKGHR